LFCPLKASSITIDRYGTNHERDESKDAAGQHSQQQADNCPLAAHPAPTFGLYLCSIYLYCNWSSSAEEA
jgi:hypothetical protein